MANYTTTFLQKATKAHGKRYNYDKLPTSFSYKDWVTITCTTHGDFVQKARTHVTGSGCPTCAKEVREQVLYSRQRHTRDQFIEKAIKTHGHKYVYSDVVYTGQMYPVTIVCPTHGPFTVVANNHVHGTGCSSCKRSRGETIIQNWLDEHHVLYETQKSFSDLSLPFVRKATNRPKFDFYLPVHNVLIEFDGKQHYQPVRFQGIAPEQALALHQRTILSDEIKTKYALTRGIALIRIPYWEIQNISSILSEAIPTNSQHSLVICADGIT